MRAAAGAAPSSSDAGATEASWAWTAASWPLRRPLGGIGGGRVPGGIGTTAPIDRVGRRGGCAACGPEMRLPASAVMGGIGC